MDCDIEGVSIGLSYTDPGKYVITAVIDDDKTVVCKVELRDLGYDDGTCDGVGNRLHGDYQHISGLDLSELYANTVDITIERDGVVLTQRSFAVQYDTEPGPNGPDCDPAECRYASHTVN